MRDPRVEKLAYLLVNYSIAVRPGEKVLLSGSASGLPLVKETYREILRAGGFPLTHWYENDFNEILYKEGNEAQITFLPESLLTNYNIVDAHIGIWSDENTRAFAQVDPPLMRLRAREVTDPILKIIERRETAGEFRWVGTQFPTNAIAQEADMSLAEYEDFAFKACFVDREDPVAAWEAMGARQEKLVKWLQGKQEVVVKGPQVDLRLEITDRCFVNGNGKVNMPCGEIFTGPVEESVNGWIRFSYPAIHAGREVAGVELRFAEGKVIEATAEKDEDFLLTMLDTDPGARYMGEFAIGTNDGIQKFTKSILYDEKIGGTIHMALGNGYPETGSKNKSAIHWDMICDMRQGGEIWVDGELFYDSGRFMVDL